MKDLTAIERKIEKDKPEPKIEDLGKITTIASLIKLVG